MDDLRKAQRDALARSTPAGQLLNRLRRMGLEIPVQAYIRRSYAGRWQRAAGAWRWWIESDGKLLDIGSQYTVTELARADKLRISVSKVPGIYGETSIDIEE